VAIVWVSEHSSLLSVAADIRIQLQRRQMHMYVYRRGFTLFLLDSNGVLRVLRKLVIIGGDPARSGVLMCHCNVVVPLLYLFFSQLGMSGEREHWAWEVIRLYGGM
jgi:hypothetical protein